MIFSVAGNRSTSKSEDHCECHPRTVFTAGTLRMSRLSTKLSRKIKKGIFGIDSHYLLNDFHLTCNTWPPNLTNSDACIEKRQHNGSTKRREIRLMLRRIINSLTSRPALLSRANGQRTIDLIRSKLPRLEPFSDQELLQESLTLQYSARSGKATDALLVDAFTLASEATRRVHSMVPYDVQFLGGINLCHHTIIEMATGEGKTLTALLPLFLRAIEGKGVLLATSNDYLAARDAEFAQPVFKMLGLTVGSVTENDEDNNRRKAYACDVTYGTAVQFGFDFLRDRAKRRFNHLTKPAEPELPVGRGRLFAILADEADSLLIDEAATPLLIAGASPPVSQEKQDAYQWAAKHAPDCQKGVHYLYNENDKKAELNSFGKQWIHERLPKTDQQQPESQLSLIDYYDFIERAINVERDLLRDRNYIISDSEVQLVDEGTGRVGKGREWSDGIQQAVQAKENLPITLPSGHLAKVTVQSFFLAFEHVSGMTGTARQAQNELWSNYKLKIREIPTRLPNRRLELPSTAYPTFEPWLEAIFDECKTMQQAGRSTLIGTRNVAHSEMISRHLTSQGMDNQLLNARLDKVEAEIIAKAGQPGRVTVATNMAGRGTDIDLHQEVEDAGGLHVILAGIHPSERVDRQLIGRAGRQGDPGSYRRMLCLQDDLLEDAFAEQAEKIRQESLARFSQSACLELFAKAQRTIARRNRISRKAMFEEDKKNLRYLHQAGLDPLLDIPG